MDRVFPASNISVDEATGHLLFAGYDVCDIASQYGTPVYLMDEERIRANCRAYVTAFSKYFPKNSRPYFASKACSFKQLYRIVGDEGLGTDLVSPGEINTAFKAGFDMSHTCFHGNCKTDSDIRFAMEKGVGFFVADNREEIDRIDMIAGERGIVQKILIRVTPGIDPHTFAAVATGKVDSKFGAAIETGQAEKLVGYVLNGKNNISLYGVHCHVGSQVFEQDVFERACEIMVRFISDIKSVYGFDTRILNIGGGIGVRYVNSDPFVDIDGRLCSIGSTLTACCERYRIEPPAIIMEPGRSIVADAGMTLYSVGSVKRIPGYRNYVAINGGMTDNPRYALYGSSYTCILANKMNEACSGEFTIAGRCCESGDLIQENVPLPDSVRREDIVAVCTTGAYNYSMSSNYNRVPRPPVVILGRSGPYIAVRRETVDDIVSLDN